MLRSKVQVNRCTMRITSRYEGKRSRAGPPGRAPSGKEVRKTSSNDTLRSSLNNGTMRPVPNDDNDDDDDEVSKIVNCIRK